MLAVVVLCHFTTAYKWGRMPPSVVYRRPAPYLHALLSPDAMPYGFLGVGVEETFIMEVIHHIVRGADIVLSGKVVGLAAAHGAEIPILGAFGCGAFQNDPAVVADAWRTALEAFSLFRAAKQPDDLIDYVKCILS